MGTSLLNVHGWATLQLKVVTTGNIEDHCSDLNYLLNVHGWATQQLKVGTTGSMEAAATLEKISLASGKMR